MDILLDAALPQVTRREPAASAAAVREQALQANPGVTSPVAVAAAAGSEQSKNAGKDERREDEADHRPSPPLSADAAGKVELKFHYEQELNRTFLDLVDGNSGDDRLTRMPPEQFARYVAQIKADAAPAADDAPRLDALA